MASVKTMETSTTATATATPSKLFTETYNDANRYSTGDDAAPFLPDGSVCRDSIQPMRFPETVYWMVEYATLNNGVDNVYYGCCWEDDVSFSITDPIAFIIDLLPLFFPSQSALRSFERSLNMWDFRRVYKDAKSKRGKTKTFQHTKPLFRRGSPKLTRNIFRRRSVKRGGIVTPPSLSPPIGRPRQVKILPQPAMVPPTTGAPARVATETDSPSSHEKPTLGPTACPPLLVWPSRSGSPRSVCETSRLLTTIKHHAHLERANELIVPSMHRHHNVPALTDQQSRRAESMETLAVAQFMQNVLRNQQAQRQHEEVEEDLTSRPAFHDSYSGMDGVPGLGRCKSAPAAVNRNWSF